MSTQQTDPVTAFWRDWFARAQTAQAGQAQQSVPGAGPTTQWPLTPEAVRQMQSAYLDAMAKYCDQHMRSPQFLDAMKKSLDQALEFRRQLDRLLKENASGAFASPGGGATGEILAAIRQSESRLNERLNDLSQRVADLEHGARPTRSRSAARSSAKPAAKTGGKKKTARRASRAR